MQTIVDQRDRFRPVFRIHAPSVRFPKGRITLVTNFKTSKWWRENARSVLAMFAEKGLDTPEKLIDAYRECNEFARFANQRIGQLETFISTLKEQQNG